MPESEDFLQIAHMHFRDAADAQRDGRVRLAARAAYSASLNAARAVLFEVTQSAPKTHSGTISKFHELIFKGALGQVDLSLATGLSDDFDVKQDIDYWKGETVGPDAGVQVEHARKLIELAESVIRNPNKK
jgi:uncharacterized protein (UPF0332 family)